MLERKTYSIAEAAKVIGISSPKMYDLCRTEGFPAIFIGRRIVIPIEKLNQWLETEAERYKAAQ